jgi:hypothetical protein
MEILGWYLAIPRGNTSMKIFELSRSGDKEETVSTFVSALSPLLVGFSRK